MIIFSHLWVTHRSPIKKPDKGLANTSKFIVVEAKTMKAQMKHLFVFGFLALLFIAGLNGVNGGGECGRTSPEREAFKLAPCAMAAQDENAPVSESCCARIKQIGQNPSCLCAVMLSNTAKSTGANPEIAVTIPKRCNLADRPVGYRCGAYILP